MAECLQVFEAIYLVASMARSVHSFVGLASPSPLDEMLFSAWESANLPSCRICSLAFLSGLMDL